MGIFSEAFWYVAPILVAATTFLSGLVNQSIVKKYIPVKYQTYIKQLISWIIGTILSCIAWGLKVILVGNPTWLGVIALSLIVGLSSNGFYDIAFIKAFIEKWFKTPEFKLPIVKADESVAIEINEDTLYVKTYKRKRKPRNRKQSKNKEIIKE